MRHRRLSAVATGAGVVVTACSVLMAFLADHHWLIGYNAMLVFERTMFWVQVAGLVLFIVGCIWLAGNVNSQISLVIGIAFVVAASLLPLVFGGYLAILNVHSWTVALCLPVAALFVSGTLFAAGGLLKRDRMS